MHIPRLGTWQQMAVDWLNSKRVWILLMVFMDSYWKLHWPLCYLNMRLKFLQWYVYDYSLLRQNPWQRLKGARVMLFMSEHDSQEAEKGKGIVFPSPLPRVFLCRSPVCGMALPTFRLEYIHLYNLSEPDYLMICLSYLLGDSKSWKLGTVLDARL